MALIRNIARYVRQLPLDGVVDPGPVELVTPVQAVRVFDDSHYAAGQVPQPRGWTTVDGPTTAGDHSGFELRAGPNGTWFHGLINSATTGTTVDYIFWFALATAGLAAPSGRLHNVTTRPSVGVVNGPQRSQLVEGEILIADIPDNAAGVHVANLLGVVNSLTGQGTFTGSGDPPGGGLFIPAEDVLIVIRQDDAVAIELTVAWRDVA